MNNDKIIEGNKLIAEFMGYKETFWNKRWFTSNYNVMKYHYDWKWLMPVVEKIENLLIYSKVQECSFPVKFSFLRNTTGKSNVILINCAVWNFSNIRIKNDCKIEAVWIACVEFIEWYNQNKET